MMVTPRCPHFGPCGGCTQQDVAYEDQLRRKQQTCEELLRRALGGDAPPVLPTRAPAPAGSDGPWGYRSKVHFVFTERGGTLALGHFRRGSRAVLPVQECPVHAPDGNALAFAVLEALRRARIPAVSSDLRRGTLRHLVVRVAAATGERLVTVVLRKPDRRVVEALANLDARDRLAASFHVNVHEHDDPYLFGATTKKVAGHARLRERIGDVWYAISPTAFFQTNVAAAEALVSLVLGAVPAGNRTVLDLYAGAGLFALPLAKRGARVIAIEENADAVADGIEGRRLNGIDAARCRFVAARVEDALARSISGRTPDAIVLDPPRSGCERRVLQQIVVTIRPPFIVYVSCNPETLARDLAIARRAGYTIDSVQPVDMFPHTDHIEAVAALTRHHAGGT